MGDEYETRPQPKPLPVISDRTRNIIIEELGVGEDKRTQDIISGIVGGERKNPATSCKEFASTVFSDIASSNPGFIEIILEALKEHHGRITGLSDAATVGMAVVLKAFDIEASFDLLPNTKNLEREDLEVIKSSIKEAVPNRGILGAKEITILEEILLAPRIPEQQTFLIECVRKAQTAYPSGSGLYTEVTRGAAGMYKALSALWPKLMPDSSNLPGPESPPIQS